MRCLFLLHGYYIFGHVMEMTKRDARCSSCLWAMHILLLRITPIAAAFDSAIGLQAALAPFPL